MGDEQRQGGGPTRSPSPYDGGPARGCPCLVVEPCGPTCSCAQPFMSGGCRRCARYGSAEQRFAAADHIANVIDAADRATLSSSKAGEELTAPEPSADKETDRG